MAALRRRKQVQLTRRAASRMSKLQLAFRNTRPMFERISQTVNPNTSTAFLIRMFSGAARVVVVNGGISQPRKARLASRVALR